MGAPPRGLRPARPGEHVAARRRALRRRGAGHHRPGLPRLGRRRSTRCTAGAQASCSRATSAGTPMRCSASSLGRFPDGAAPPGMMAGDAGRRRPLASRAVTSARRRIYLMRHAQVRYFEGLDAGAGRAHRGRPPPGAHAARERCRESRSTASSTSGLARTLETAAIVAPGIEPERALRAARDRERRAPRRRARSRAAS